MAKKTAPKSTAAMKRAQRSLDEILKTVEPFAAQRPAPRTHARSAWTAVPRETTISQRSCSSRFA